MDKKNDTILSDLRQEISDLKFENEKLKQQHADMKIANTLFVMLFFCCVALFCITVTIGGN